MPPPAPVTQALDALGIHCRFHLHTQRVRSLVCRLEDGSKVMS